MEFRAQDIAQLVLGYLKDEKCQSAFSEFLNNSEYLKDHAASYRRGKYFITRVAGLNLVDYLSEYAVIYTIVQERLEASEYYSENRSRTTLVKQLLYLLENADIQSRTSTPIHDNITSKRSRREDTTARPSLVDKEVQHVPENISNNSFERLCAGISATSTHSLPGNSSSEISFLNSSKNKSATSVPRVNKSTSTEDNTDLQEKSQEKIQIFTQTFFENRELIEKLTENINKEVCSKSTPQLDSSSIQSIVQQTEADPVFVQLFTELFESTHDEDDENRSNCSPDKDAENQEKLDSDLPKVPDLPTTPKKIPDVLSTSNCLKQRLRSSKKSHASPCKTPPSIIEEQNNQAIQSIVAASLSNEKQPVDSEGSVSSNTSSMPVDVVVPTNTYDNFIHTSFAGPSNQNQMYTNTGGLLMLQPSGTVPCSNVATRNLQVDPPKPCYIIGNQPFINVNVPQTPFKMLTEQDILTMPTIFVCDNNQQPTNSQAVIMAPSGTTSSVGQNRLVNIAPKMTPDKAQSLSEYITLYQCNDSFTSVVAHPQVPASTSKPRSKLKQITATTNKAKKTADKTQCHTSLTEKAPVSTQSDAPPLTEFLNFTNSASQTSTDNIAAENVPKEADGTQKPSTEDKHITPKLKAAEKKELLSRSTSRSGSHIRQLDFSTPEKWLPLLRRANTSPKMEKPQEHKETPVKSVKTNTSKSIRTSLFKSPDVEIVEDVPDPPTSAAEIQNKQGSGEPGDVAKTMEIPETSTTPLAKSSCAKTSTATSSWDADLRALAGPSASAPAKTVAQKQKRKRIEESPKQSSSKKLKENPPNLNKTEEDALKIEMALTSIGTETESAEAVTKGQNENAKAAKPATKRRDRLTTKKVISVKKIGKTSKDKQPSEKTVEAVPNPPADKLAAISVNVDDDASEPLEKKSVIEQNSLEKPYAVINRNMKSRIKRKCNMESVGKKTPIPEEIVLTNVPKIRSCEILDDGKNTLILSPSKLNANKRTLVEMENRVPIVEQSVVSKSTDDLENKETTDGKFTTPELGKTTTSNPPLTAKRNIMPILETPVKFDSIAIPKTPGISNSPLIDTPFTKAVIDQLTGVDINAIPTPRFPITPNFPFTPAHDQSPFSNRGTDYSTSSSYYQPSDTEQNKSLEQLIEECRRLEAQPASVKTKKDVLEEKNNTATPEKADSHCQGVVNSPASSQTISKSQQIETVKNIETSSVQSQSEPSQVIKNLLSEKEKAFNHSMVGKKNLQLVKMLSDDADEKDSSTESSSSECDSSSTSSDDSDSSNCSFAELSTAASNDRNSSPYSLRPRKPSTNNPTASSNVSKDKEAEERQKPINEIEPDVSEQSSEKDQAKPLTFQDGILKKMEQIRQRTIAKVKNINLNVNKSESSKKKKPASQLKKTARVVKVPATARQLRKANPTKPEKTVEDVPPLSESSDAASKKASEKLPDNSTKRQRKSDSPRNIKQQETFTQKNENLAVANLVNKNNQNRTKERPSKKLKQSEPPAQKGEISGTSKLTRRNSQAEVKSIQPEPSIQKGQNIVTNLSLKSNENETCSVKEPESSNEKEGKAESSTSAVKCKNKIKPESPKKLKQPEYSSQKEAKPQIKYITIKEAKAMVDEEEDIILHLSSEDEETLEPFEMVETELLECSVSSTPIAEENRTADPVLDMTSSVNREPLNKQESEDKADDEAESLVKGLKQWGIHLVPNKPSKKSLTSTETMEGIFSGTKVDEQDSGCPNEEVLKSKITEKPATPKEKCREKGKDKLNRSIEEGELVSDGEKSPKKEIKLKVEPTKIKVTNTSHSRRNSDSIRENKKGQDQQRSFRETHRSKSFSETKSISSSKNPSSLPAKSLKNSAGRNLSSKPTKPSVKAPEKVAERECKDKSTTTNVKEIAVNELDYQVEFDLRTYEQETFSITHDYSKKSSRKITDYNFDILSKKFAANVYIAEIDSEVEKLLLFTPFEFLLDVPSKSSTSVPQKRSIINDKPSTSQTQAKKRQKPLNILFNQLVKPAGDPQPQPSPLDGLYAPESSSRETKRIVNETSKKTSERNTRNEKSDKSSSSKQKSKEKIPREQSQSKSLERGSKDSTSERQDLKTKQQIVNKATSSVTKPMKSNKSATIISAANKEENNKQLANDLEVVDGVIMLNSNVEDTEQREVDDELMNYALIGSERVEDSEESFLIENKKRKTAEVADGDKHQQKKRKPEELLRTIDVDSFLKKLHGET